MNFSTINFWLVLLPSLVCIFIFIHFLNYKYKNIFYKYILSILSLSLLGLESVETLFIFLFVIFSAFIACLYGINLKNKAKHILLAFLIMLIFIPLFYYKYANFICNDIAGMKWNTFHNLIIPIGISFYSFQIAGFCIDTLLKNKPMPKFIDYLNFASFFPQIVAGPIERRSDLLPQLTNIHYRSLNINNLTVGIPFIFLGLFFKITLADNIANTFYENYYGCNAWIIWLNNLLFTFRIYFDFAGYGFMAYGIAKCMGITLRMNFLSPYTACNITEFWRRWHTSLTLWFRDYIYFPMGGSRTSKWILNIIIVFTISGIWHGAGWNFIIWGTFSGTAMVIHRIFRNHGLKLPSIIGWFLTFLTMVFVWMFFYDSSPNLLNHHLKILFDWHNYNFFDFAHTLLENKRGTCIALVFLIISFAVVFLEFLSLRKYKEEPYKLFLSPYACCIMIFLMVVFNNSVQNSFIYFAF